ncbi:MAG: hypothetical protein IT458_18025 [Planctomycetes bacterium]|nr:hypothetical protein [Planctomycetota bacterium]
MAIRVLVVPLLTGASGLLVELVAVRRHGLLLGNTSEAMAVVVGIFLLALGAGGVVGPRLAVAARRPVRTAAWTYLLVAVLVVAGDLLLGRLRPPSFALGVVSALVAPGLAALAMGAAFPLLVAGLGPGPSTWVLAANLAGSVLAAGLGGNLLLPELGYGSTALLAAGGYACAGLLLHACREPEAGRGPAAAVAVGSHEFRTAAGAGLLVGGLQILMMRRLPFFLEGFQPTFSGVLAAFLLGLTLGAALLTPLLARLGPGAATVALGTGGAAIALGLLESLAPALASGPAASTAAMHARIWWVAAAVSALATLPLGAVVPLLVRAAPDPRRAGVLFLAQGVGSLAGALLVGQVLPRLAPAAFFQVTPAALLAAAWLLAGIWAGVRADVRWVLVPTSLACAALGFWGAGRPPVQGSRYDRPDRYRYLVHRSDEVLTASVVYDRASHSLALFTDEFRAAYTGPGTTYMQVLGHLPFLLREGLRDAAVLALGTGTTANAVCAWPDPERVHVVEISRAVLDLVGRFASDGPVDARRTPVFLADPRTQVHVADARRFLGTRDPASLDLIAMEPLLPYAPGTLPLYSREFYALARTALRPRGLLVQWVPTHAMPEAYYRVLLRTFAEAFPHASAWLFDQSTLLVGSTEAHLPGSAELQRRFAAAPRAALHLAGLGGSEDLALALQGTDLRAALGPGEVVVDVRPRLERIGHWSGPERLDFFRANARVLAAIAQAGGSDPFPVRLVPARDALREGVALLTQVPLQGRDAAALAVQELARARSIAPAALLLHREETRALRLLRELQVAEAPGPAAPALATTHLARDAGSALLQAALGLPDGEGRRLLTPDEAGMRAHAVDPTWLARAPAALRPPRPPAADLPSPREDLGVLPSGAALATAVAARDLRALALRGTFPERCAQALVQELRLRALSPDERDALRGVLDPVGLEEAAEAVAARAGDVGTEILPLWRRDLPMPAALAGMQHATALERRRLAEALGGRRGARECAVLADLLLDPDAAVRSAAGVALHQGFRDTIPYDPEWQPERRKRAADALRALHNRPP